MILHCPTAHAWGSFIICTTLLHSHLSLNFPEDKTRWYFLPVNTKKSSFFSPNCINQTVLYISPTTPIHSDARYNKTPRGLRTLTSTLNSTIQVQQNIIKIIQQNVGDLITWAILVRWLASTEGKTHLEDRETEMEGKWGESSDFYSILFFFIFGADVFPFTNSDIYGFVRTINATIPFHSLSKFTFSI